MSKRRFTREFKLTAVRRMQVGEPVARLARELEISPGELYRWCHEQEKLGAGAFMGSGYKRSEADRVAELERKIGQQVRALAGGARSTNKSNGKSQRDEV